MRLTDLIGLVKTVTDYDPSVETYNDEIRRLLNNALLELFAEKAWVFAQKEVTVTAHADVTGTVSVTNGATAVTAMAFGEDWMDGQIIAIDEVEYDIAWVDTVGSILYLRTAYAGITAGGVSAKVKERYIDLPQDTVSLLNISTRDRTGGTQPKDIGRFVPLTRYEDDWWGIPLDETGTSTHWVPHDDANVPSPVEAATSALLAGPPNLTSGTTYSFVRTLKFAGRRSSPSPVVTATPTGGTLRVDVNLPATGIASGYFQELWMKFAPYDAYRLTGQVTIPSSVTTTITIQPPASDWQFNERLKRVDGNYQRVRLYPRQGTDTVLSIRYLYRPQLLMEETDAPEFPAAHHQYLAYKALSDVFVKHDNLPQHKIYLEKAEEEIIKMEQRYLTELSRRWVKGEESADFFAYRSKWGPLTHS